MSQDHPSHNDSGSGPVTGSAAPDSRGFPFKGDTRKATKVKRRKTKKELDSAKFKSHIETFRKKTLPRGFLQRSSAVGRTGMNSQQVFITDHRLTQHQGIFNREVKSVDIGRLMEQVVELDPSLTGADPCTSVRKTPQNQGSLRIGLIPTPESKNVSSPEQECSPEDAALISEPAACNQQTEEKEAADERPPRPQSDERPPRPQSDERPPRPQSDERPPRLQSDERPPRPQSDERPPRPQSDERANPGSGTRTSPCRNKSSPIPEAAEIIVNMLNAHSLFPGRNLTSEIRRAILEKVRKLREPKSTPPAVPEQRKPECSQIGDVPVHRDQACPCAAKEETAFRRTQGARLPIQTPPTQVLPFPRVSPACTLIKMVNPAEHLKLKEIRHQPTNYGSHYSPSRPQISSHAPHNMLNINSNRDPTLSRPGRKTSRFCRIRIAGKTTCSSLNSGSPQVRWRLAKDPLTDPSYTHSVPPGNIGHILDRVTNKDCVSRTSLEDISSELLNPPGVRMKRRFSLDRTSSDVFWGGRDQRSVATKIPDDTSPAMIRTSYREQSPASSHCSGFLQTPIPGAHGFLSVFPLDSFGESGREIKRPMSSWQEADTGQHYGRTMPRQRHEAQHHILWNSPCLLQEEPRVHKDGGKAWIHSKDWPHGRSRGEQSITPVALSPQSVQQEFSFNPFPRGNSSKKQLLSRSSPVTWTYPRMKLY
ncbi:uncharacterized protein LOC120990995 [Bufo bufo]|uniref:uncharacterized protein LOC120990995 n=1 Tax=Bufo bufo TaxID=8384 RepID=UPI001ABE3CCE|nr:uncharacterized protein LOC120990995 [Bufo bufo]